MKIENLAKTNYVQWQDPEKCTRVERAVLWTGDRVEGRVAPCPTRKREERL